MLGSVASLAAMGIPLGRTTGAMLRTVLLVAVDRLWSLVYSQIPLKDGLERGWQFLGINVVIMTIGTAISRTRPVAAPAGAGFAILGAASAAPPIYAGAILVMASASSWLAQQRRKTE